MKFNTLLYLQLSYSQCCSQACESACSLNPQTCLFLYDIKCIYIAIYILCQISMFYHQLNKKSNSNRVNCRVHDQVLSAQVQVRTWVTVLSSSANTRSAVIEVNASLKVKCKQFYQVSFVDINSQHKGSVGRNGVTTHSNALLGLYCTTGSRTV